MISYTSTSYQGQDFGHLNLFSGMLLNSLPTFLSYNFFICVVPVSLQMVLNNLLWRTPEREPGMSIWWRGEAIELLRKLLGKVWCAFAFWGYVHHLLDVHSFLCWLFFFFFL